MSTKAMIVVGGGSSSRFGGDKLLVELAGKPLVAHTVSAVRDLVDKCVLVTRADIVKSVSNLDLGVDTVPGGTSRTLSEMAGLAALGEEFGLIGIHDAARPLVDSALIDQLFRSAESTGGAVPVCQPDRLLVDRRLFKPVEDAVVVQTPQIFRGPELFAAYVRSAEAGYDAHDTAEIVHRFGKLEIAAVPGDPNNTKVTYPEDLQLVSDRLTRRLDDSSADPSHNGPR